MRVFFDTEQGEALAGLIQRGNHENRSDDVSDTPHSLDIRQTLVQSYQEMLRVREKEEFSLTSKRAFSKTELTIGKVALHSLYIINILHSRKTHCFLRVMSMSAAHSRQNLAF